MVCPGNPSSGIDTRAVVASDSGIVDVFATTGFAATTMKEIAERAGISERGLGHHFPSNAELLAAVLERREAINATRMPLTPGADVLLAMIDIVAGDLHERILVELHS